MTMTTGIQHLPVQDQPSRARTCLPARVHTRRIQQTLEVVFDGIEIGISSDSFVKVDCDSKLFHLVCCFVREKRRQYNISSEKCLGEQPSSVHTI